MTGRRPDGAGRAGRAGALVAPGYRSSRGGLSSPAEHAQEAVLTTIADTIIPGTGDDHDSPPPEERELAQGGEQDEEAAFTERPMIPVALLIAHPGNVREDRQAGRAFCQSVAAAGILVPLEITTSPGGDGYVVVDGNIRLDAAVKTGLAAVPYVFSPDTADDAGLQYLHMLISSRFRRDLTVHEEAAALFSAAEAGMTRAQIRKATGLKAAEVRAGISAGGLSEKTRELASGAGYEWDLEELALLKPFEDDPAVMQRILASVECGSPVRYVVQRITDEREARVRRDKLTADLEASGVTVLDQVPPGAVRLGWLRADITAESDGGSEENPDHDGQDDDADGGQDARELDPAGHASCPGAIAVLHSWQDEPAYYCLDPARYGHAQLHQSMPAPFPPAPHAGEAGGGPGPERSPDPDRRLVIEGNKAWAAAGTVRQRWLSEFLSRKAPPSGSAAVIARFVTTQLITMPQPLRQALGSIRDHRVYRELGGPAADAAETASQPRLWLLALAPIAAAYEDQMTGTGDQRATWRTDRYAPCPRADAGAWLRLIAQLGYQLSPVEQAVADGVPYLGDTADGNEPLTAGDPGQGDLPDGDQDGSDQGPPEHGSEPGDDAGLEVPGSSAEGGDAGSPVLAA
jgi:ParB family chromosome partitioning protein